MLVGDGRVRGGGRGADRWEVGEGAGTPGDWQRCGQVASVQPARPCFPADNAARTRALQARRCSAAHNARAARVLLTTCMQRAPVRCAPSRSQASGAAAARLPPRPQPQPAATRTPAPCCTAGSGWGGKPLKQSRRAQMCGGGWVQTRGDTGVHCVAWALVGRWRREQALWPPHPHHHQCPQPSIPGPTHGAARLCPVRIPLLPQPLRLGLPPPSAPPPCPPPPASFH